MKNKKLPKYLFGGGTPKENNKQNVENIFTNSLKATADVGLSMLGASNVIKDNDYKGSSAAGFRGYSDVMGGIGKAILPIAANMLLPGSGAVVGAGQQLVGNFNPEDNSMVTYDSQGNPIYPEQRKTQMIGNSLGQVGSSLGSMGQSAGMFAMGGMNMQPNAEVEKQENTLNPDGTTTQFDGPSHEQGGIPTNLDPGTMIFSDKLKYNGKTFADLNKANLTHHEDKILNDPSAKKDVKDVANALKAKKINNSLSLFKIQEELKQSKLDKYTKRLGGIMKYPNGGKIPSYLQDEINFNKKLVEDYGSAILGSGMQSDMLNNSKIGLNKFDILLSYKSKDVPDHIKYSGDNVSKLMNGLKFYEDKYQKHSNGGIQEYPLGGTVDNTKFTPAQRQQAYTDSMTLYKSGFDKNVPNWQKEPEFNNAILRLNKLNGKIPQSTDKRQITYNTEYLKNHSVPYAKPVAPKVNYKKENNSFKQPYSMDRIPLQELKAPEPIINPQLRQVTANSPSTIKTNIVTAPNYSYKQYKQGNEELDRMYFDPKTQKEINVGTFRRGGQIPKFDDGAMFGYKPTNKIDAMKMQQAYLNNQNPQSWITPEMNQASSDAMIEESYPTNNIPVNPNNVKRTDNIDYSDYNQKAYDDELARMNASGGNKNQNWFGRNSDKLYQLGFGLAQNIGQMSYLKEQGKNYDTQQFYDYKPSLLDPTMDLKDAQSQNNRAEYNVRGASGGNAGTYLSNRVALNAQNTMNKSRIHQAYANANSGIKNQAEQYNIANKYATDDINARNKGAALTNYYNTLGSVGTNVAQGMKDNRMMNMDNESIQLMSEFYNSPEGQKMFAKYKKEKGIKSKKD
jgi:hypothetical protein